jgi:uncharacterized protein YcfJ
MQAGDTYTTTETRCETVHDTHEELVSYELGDQRGTVRMDRDPGAQIPVREGQLVLAEQ